MSIGGTLIVGAGQAGVELAAALRAAGDDRPITMIGAERHAPYQRPPLSKGFLEDPSDAGNLLLRDSTWFAQQDITVVCGESVDGLVWESGTAWNGAYLHGTGNRVCFPCPGDRGHPAAVVLCPGPDLGGIHYLRSVEDCQDACARPGEVSEPGGHRGWIHRVGSRRDGKAIRLPGHDPGGCPPAHRAGRLRNHQRRSICRQFSGGERRCAPERI